MSSTGVLTVCIKRTHTNIGGSSWLLGFHFYRWMMQLIPSRAPACRRWFPSNCFFVWGIAANHSSSPGSGIFIMSDLLNTTWRTQLLFFFFYECNPFGATRGSFKIQRWFYACIQLQRGPNASSLSWFGEHVCFVLKASARTDDIFNTVVLF